MNAAHHLSLAEWQELDNRLRPDFIRRVAEMQRSLSVSCVRDAYTHPMPQAIAFAQALLGGDDKRRYDEWLPGLTGAMQKLHDIGVAGYADLVERICTRDGVESLLAQSRIDLTTFAGLSYYLRYWLIPIMEPLRELIDPGDAKSKVAVQTLKEAGIASSLDLLESAGKAEARRRLAVELRIPLAVLASLVHRADMRRLPFHSCKTISYLIAAGAGSMAELAAFDPQHLVDQVIGYGQSIGKNLRYGVEPANSARMARLLPAMVEDD